VTKMQKFISFQIIQMQVKKIKWKLKQIFFLNNWEPPKWIVSSQELMGRWQ